MTSAARACDSPPVRHILTGRKFYGTTVALRLSGTFWLVTSAAGLATEYLFAAVGLVPLHRGRGTPRRGWPVPVGIVAGSAAAPG